MKKMRKVIFLDRDGIINFEPGHYTYQIEKFKFVDGLFGALQVLQRKGYEFIVITNQGGIAKGIYTHQDVDAVHLYMEEKLKKEKIPLLAIYYCPHHTVIEKCICRKPDSLMLEKAMAKHNVDIEKAYFLGDNERDVLAAKKAGIKGVLVKSNDNLNKYLNHIN